MFEQALRENLRFPTVRGEFTTEQLWDVPLRSRDDFNLNMVARTASRALEAITEESFVDTNKNTPAKKKAALRLEIVKYVIATKLSEEEDAKKRVENKLEHEKLLAILAEKKEGKLSELSEKELQKRINALGE